MWLVMAMVELYGVTKQIPIFYLNSRVQGILDVTTAEKVVKDIIDPFNLLNELHINVRATDVPR